MKDEAARSEIFFVRVCHLFVAQGISKLFDLPFHLGSFLDIFQYFIGVVHITFRPWECIGKILQQGIQPMLHGVARCFFLKGCKGMFQKAFHFIRRMGEQKIESHGKIDVNLAQEGLRRGILQIADELRILMKTGNHDSETDAVFSPPAGPADHLVKLGRREIDKFVSIEAITLHQNNGSSRKINPGRNRGCGKDGLQISFVHHFFNEHFPVRQLSPVMGSHPRCHQGFHLTVPLQMRICL